MSEEAGPTFEKIEEPIQETVDAAITKGMMVATIVVDWEGEKRKALLFSFATHDGDLLPPIVYIGDDLGDVAALVNSAAEHAETIDVDAVEVKAGE